MGATILTVEDLEAFKLELLASIKQLFIEHDRVQLKKQLRSSDLMKQLNISSGALQNLRINGTFPYSKVGGLIFYQAEDIQRIINENRIDEHQIS